MVRIATTGTFVKLFELDGGLTILFGGGLVGGAIADELELRGARALGEWVCHWNHLPMLRDELAQLARGVCERPRGVVDWIWAAGTSGFGTSMAQADRELALFDAVVRTAAATAGDSATRFHVVSSAGGAYESLRCADLGSGPVGTRPYAALKLAQEDLAGSLLGADRVWVYRLSSVYGCIRPGRRLGLVSTLIVNALRRRTTRIFGAFDTLRDYVWAADVARYLVGSLASQQATGSGTHILASARPVSIFEMRALVRRVTGIPPYVQCVGDENAASTTFSSSALPEGFVPSPLDATVRRVFRDALASGSAFRG